MSRARPLVASIVRRADPGTVPLLASVGWERLDLTLLSFEPGSVPSITPEALGVNLAPLRFGLRTDDLISFLKPTFLRWVLDRNPERDVLFIDAACFVCDPDAVDSFEAAADVVVFPTLPPGLAAGKRSQSAAVARGLGVPTVRVAAMRDGATATSVLERWITWVHGAYTSDPLMSISDAEQRFLATVPGSTGGAAWDTRGLFGRWSDLGRGISRPAVVGMEGAEEHLRDDDPSQELLTTRLDRPTDHADLLERYRRVEPEPVIEFRSGDVPSPETRSILRAVDPFGSRWPDPADDLAEDGFRTWLEHRDSRGLSRFDQAVYWSRPDLWRSFPPARTNVETLSAWMASSGLRVSTTTTRPPVKTVAARAHSVAEALAARYRFPGARSLATARSAPLAEPNGVNLIGFASAGTGLGVAMRSMIRAVENLAVPYDVIDASDRIFAPSSKTTGWTPGCHKDLTIYHLSPREILDYAGDTLAYRSVGSYHVGFWFWETDRIPRAWLGGIDLVDEIWVSSTFVADAFGRETDKPIRVIGLPVDPPASIEPDRARFDLPRDDFVVLFVADAFSSSDRKNPLAAIEAFRLAFGPDYRNVHLVLKLGNLDVFPRLADELRRATHTMPVTVITENLDRDSLWRLVAAADTYLSLHAAEGLGLTILEAMAAGVPVVVTDFGGSTEFAGPTNALTVRYEKVPATGRIYGGHGSWAAPDVSQAAEHLRRLHGDASLRRRMADAGRATAERTSPAEFTGKVADRLRSIGFALGG